MAVVGNFYFSIFLRLTWKFLGFESEREGSVYWPTNKIIDYVVDIFIFCTGPALLLSSSRGDCECLGIPQCAADGLCQS